MKCNVPKRGWINGVGGCPNVGGICIGCTMPGFPDKFMPFMDEPPGGKLSTTAVGLYGTAIRRLRDDHHAGPLDKEPKWRTPGHASSPPAPRAPGDRPHHRTTDPEGEAHDDVDDSQPQHRSDRRDNGLVEMAWDPITRIVGSLGHLHQDRLRADARSPSATAPSSIFRGYSIFMKGKDPRDAHFITSRICGICGDNHATCSCYAQNMAYGVKPPHLGEWIVNLGEAAEYMFDHNIFQENLVGVDYCEKMVARDQPRRARAGRTAPRRRTPATTATGPSATSCGRSTRSPASSTARRCRSAARPARCSA